MSLNGRCIKTGVYVFFGASKAERSPRGGETASWRSIRILTTYVHFHYKDTNLVLILGNLHLLVVPVFVQDVDLFVHGLEERLPREKQKRG